MTFEEWVAAYAGALGVPAPGPEEIDSLLELAAAAAHSSERRAAPITCWLAARSALTPEQAVEVAHQLVGGTSGR